ncbi:hypothetical protein [Photobacterium sp. R1]
MIRIEQYTDDRQEETGALTVKADQAEFTIGRMPEILAKLQSHEHACLITVNRPVAGFLFWIQTMPRRIVFVPKAHWV